MTTLLIIALIFGCFLSGAVGYARGLRKVRKVQKSIQTPAPSVPRKPISSKRHKLERTFADRRIAKPRDKNGQDFHGWHFICTCGTIAPAVDNFGTDGSDAGAIKAWHDHASLHASLVDAGDDELAEVKAAFEKYKQECFCHDLEGK